MLSERARRYLASLKRVKPVPTADVERALREQGSPCFPAWLDFHERYAGYVELLGAEVAIWGIVHEESHWLKPGRAVVEKAYGEEAAWFATCAEVHGSYTYLLGDTGVFVSDRTSESFDIYVERNAVRAEFAQDSSRAPKVWFDLQEPAFLERVHRECSVVEEASDRYFRVFLGDALFAVESLRRHRFAEALVRNPGK